MSLLGRLKGSHYLQKKFVEKYFEEEFYLGQLKGESIGDLDPISHYFQMGVKAGLDPCPWFSTSHYLNANEDVAVGKINPFYHYLKHGKAEGRLAVKSQEGQGVIARKWDKSEFSSETKLDSNFFSSKIYVTASKLIETRASADEWDEFVGSLTTQSGPHPFAKAFLEAGVANSLDKEAVLVGWVVKEPNSVIWAETATSGPVFFDEAFRMYRSDVVEAFSASMSVAEIETGFILNMHNVEPEQIIQVKALSSLGVHLITEIGVAEMPANPKDLASWLFSVHTPQAELPKRFEKVDLPVLAKAISRQVELANRMPVTVDQYGQPKASPKVSVIVPLYGRADFIEGQLIEFSRDPFFQHEVELVYVIDDPALVGVVKPLMNDLFRIYQYPCKVVWGGVNRGFSGANNLGLLHSEGSHVLFLNSDVFPNSPGWLERLLEKLDADESIGVVVPKLLFADGSIQHAGMESKWRSDLGIWVNHHPNMGLSPDMDPNKTDTAMDLVTGACMLMKRSVIEELGGWDEGYLIGDFEDSDLCYNLKSKGMHCLYTPEVQLTHLERQSFSLTGSGDFRFKTVLLNATRHQLRWKDYLN